jgi:hypothetical protein
MHKTTGIRILLGLAVVTIVAMLFVPPIPQDPAYHGFSDARPWLGIPNFGDVMSNLPFLLVGFLGFRVLKKYGGDTQRFIDAREKRFFAIAVFGIGLTGLGSAYYHWAPGNVTLVWDRLPMTIGFMAIFAMMIAERIDLDRGLKALPVLLAIGVASVVYWHFTESAGRGDLRPYALVQFFPMLAVPLMIWLFPPRYTGVKYLGGVLAWYVAAKLLEHFDGVVFALTGHIVSGHSLKHLCAAVACYELVRYIENRRQA